MKLYLSCLQYMRYIKPCYTIIGWSNFQGHLGSSKVIPCRCYKTSTALLQFQRRVESNWLQLLTRMADIAPADDINVPGSSRDQAQRIRSMLSRAVRVKRTQEGGDLMPNAVAKEVCHLYKELSTTEEKMAFFLVMERDLGVDHKEIQEVAQTLLNIKDQGIPVILRTEDRLRQVLEPHYIQLLSNISRLEGGVKFIVDLRNDLLEILSKQSALTHRQELQDLSSSIKTLLAQWFAVGLLDLQRITWNTPCSMLEKIIKYEAVHTIKGWDDLKRRLAPDRRVYAFTHRSMPREPIVVLHAALEYDIPDNMQSILSEPEVGTEESEFELENRTTAAFYSISSTQKGLTGVELGKFLIKNVVQELQHDFPNITQYATLSPIPGFSQWLLVKLNESITNEGTSTSILLEDELSKLSQFCQDQQPPALFKDLIQRSDWYLDTAIIDCVKKPLIRLCTRYLYQEKRRGFAMDPVANFHIRNGAWMWRLNWLADISPRGLANSYGLMINYRYILDDVDHNNQQYLFNGHIAASQNFTDSLNQ